MERTEKFRCPGCGAEFDRSDDCYSVDDIRFLSFVVDRAIKHQRQIIIDLERSNVWMAKEEVMKQENDYLKKLESMKRKLPLPEPPKEDE